MGDRQTVVVAGAGIGGLTTALSLAAAGFHVVLCERARQLSEVGAGIQLSPNASSVLATLALEPALAAAAIEPAAIEIRSGSSGALVGSLDASLFSARYGIPWRVIHRADLQSILASAVAATAAIELRLGVSVTSFSPGPGVVAVRLEHPRGHDAIDAAALIGADGVRSGLREAMGGPPARPTGRAAWRAIIPSQGALRPLSADRVGLWLGRDAHLVHYPVSAGRSINLVAIVEESLRGEGWSEPGDPYALAAYFTNWSDDVRAIIAAPAEWRRFAISTVDAGGRWVGDRVALLGDAAHAMTPFLAQGAAMAIEDASVLGRCLAAAPDDIPAGLRAYEAERQPRAARVAAASKSAGDTYHFGAIAATARDLALRLAPARTILTQNDWIYRWRPAP